jgi:hypothetical protein
MLGVHGVKERETRERSGEKDQEREREREIRRERLREKHKRENNTTQVKPSKHNKPQPVKETSNDTNNEQHTCLCYLLKRHLTDTHACAFI